MTRKFNSKGTLTVKGLKTYQRFPKKMTKNKSISVNSKIKLPVVTSQE